MIKPLGLESTASSPVDLSGKAAIVTGGATPVSRGIAEKLAASGANVMLADLDLEATSRTAAELRANGCRVWAVQADALQEGGAERLIRATKEAFSRIDILVLNAGSETRAPTSRRRRDDNSSVAAASVGDLATLSRAVAREIVSAGTGGKIIVISPESEVLPAEEVKQSEASKAAVDVFLTSRSAVRVTYSQDAVGNLIEITSRLTDHTMV